MIVDCFTFYNECDILKKRINYLSPVVDKFVIVESTVTHKGNPKELFFDESQFDMSKIVRVIVEDNPSDEDPWKRENHQRNCITRGLKTLELSDEDVIMVSDVDEIPNRDTVKNATGALISHPVISFHMLAFEYSFDFMQTREPWFGTVMSTWKKFKESDEFPQFLRNNRWHFPKIIESGWHMSTFGDPKFIANKIHNFAHCNDRDISNVNEEFCKNLLENGLTTDGVHNHTPTPQQLKDSIPKELI